MTDQSFSNWARKLLRRSTLHRHRTGVVTVGVLGGLLSCTGCVTSHSSWDKTLGNDTCEVDSVMQQVDAPAPPAFSDIRHTPPPVTLASLSTQEIHYVDKTLSEVMYEGLGHSAVLRDIGGTLLRSPDSVQTSLSRQLQETDPRFGAEAALSAFDAQLSATANFNKNDRIYNNSFFAGGATAYQQDYHDYQTELSKRTASGSYLALRGVTNYDANNAPANTFPSAWNSWVEGELRQPLLQGGGLEFNRIAGPGSTPGIYNGVLIAKVNGDMNAADFSVALRDYVSNVENAYWDLYIAFREYDARKRALEHAEKLKKDLEGESRVGRADQAELAHASQQYYQLKSEVDEAMYGKLLTGTQVRNGATGGTVQNGGGVLAAERRLRLLIGLPASDGTILRPADEPTVAEIPFDWDSAVREALSQRPELQKQNIAVKKRAMELLAARNFLNPRLDAVGKYRFRGFGDDLLGNGNQGGTSPASSAGNLATGNQQEWTLGVELTVPIGYRKAHAAVSHGELNLMRERTIQKEQQREIISHLTGAFVDKDRAYVAVQNGLAQYLEARKYAEVLASEKIGGRTVATDRELDAQRKLVQSEVQFFRARAEYAIALKNLHYEKGSLLQYKDLRVAGNQFEHSDTEFQIDGETLPAPGETVAPPIPETPAAGLQQEREAELADDPAGTTTPSTTASQAAVLDSAVKTPEAEVKPDEDPDNTDAFPLFPTPSVSVIDRLPRLDFFGASEKAAEVDQPKPKSAARGFVRMDDTDF